MWGTTKLPVGPVEKFSSGRYNKGYNLLTDYLFQESSKKCISEADVFAVEAKRAPSAPKRAPSARMNCCKPNVVLEPPAAQQVPNQPWRIWNTSVSIKVEQVLIMVDLLGPQRASALAFCLANRKLAKLPSGAALAGHVIDVIAHIQSYSDGTQCFMKSHKNSNKQYLYSLYIAGIPTLLLLWQALDEASGG